MVGNYACFSNSLDPDQARHFVGPDLGPNCYLRLSADNNGSEGVNDVHLYIVLFCLFDLIMSHQQSFSYVGTGLPGLIQY